MVMTRKYIDDMFHSLRTHVCLTWILAMVMHIVTGNFGDSFWDYFKFNFGDNFKFNFGDNFKVKFGDNFKINLWGLLTDYFGAIWDNLGQFRTI